MSWTKLVNPVDCDESIVALDIIMCINCISDKGNM